MEHAELKEFFDKDYLVNQTTRERGSDDLVFYWVTQWDDNSLSETQLAYRGEFNILRKAGRGVLADLASNPVQVDFEPVDEGRDDAADVADGLYRADCNNNTSIEAFTNAQQETVVCGMGAWEITTEYESIRSEDSNQVIVRKPISEANNTVFFAADSRLLDKSDATRCTILTGYTEEGYKDVVKELTGEDEEEINPESFGMPVQPNTFSWIGEGTQRTMFIATMYVREIVKKKIITFLNPIGQEITLYEDDLKDKMNDMIDSGFEIVSEKEISKYQVTKYILSGKEILNGEMGSDEERLGEVIAGEHIPVIPSYGERAIIGGEEHWEGITRLAKDPQRLRNFQMSYLADIVSQSPRVKPIFTQEQIAGFEDYYSLSGSENNFAYLLQNSRDEHGPLPVGPVGVMPEQPIPTALTASIALSREAVEDVANPGIPKDYPSREVPKGTITQLQQRIDMQSMVYQENMKHAKRRDGEVWASIASEIYDVPRTVSVTLPDGTRKKVKMMDQVLDESGEIITLNDIYNTEFKVFSTIGPSYMSQKEQTISTLREMLVSMSPEHPTYQIIMLMLLQLTDGVEFKPLREYGRKQLVLQGIIEPDTDEEKKMLAEAQANQQPSAEMVLAMAEDKKGQADLLEQQRKGIEMQLNAQIKDIANKIDGFEAQTKRMEAQIKAQEASAKIDNTNIDTFGKQIDNEIKIRDMSDEQLLKELSA